MSKIHNDHIYLKNQYVYLENPPAQSKIGYYLTFYSLDPAALSYFSILKDLVSLKRAKAPSQKLLC